MSKPTAGNPADHRAEFPAGAEPQATPLNRLRQILDGESLELLALLAVLGEATTRMQDEAGCNLNLCIGLAERLAGRIRGELDDALMALEPAAGAA